MKRADFTYKMDGEINANAESLLVTAPYSSVV